MRLPTIGEFEELVLLAVCGLKDEAYAVHIQQRIEHKTRRNATMGAVYTALERLDQKGFLQSYLGEVTRQKGGRRKRFYTVTQDGVKVLHLARVARERMWEDLDFNPGLVS